MDTNRSDVLVLGAGVVGLACAHYLLKAGRSVTVVDQGRVGSGSSHGNCGTITPSHAQPLAVPGMVGKALKMMLSRDAPFYVKPRLDFELIRWMLQFAHRCRADTAARGTLEKAAILNDSRRRLIELMRDENLDCGFEQLGTLYVARTEAGLEDLVAHAAAVAEAGIPGRRVDRAEALALEPALRDDIVGGVLHPEDCHLRPDRYVAELARRVREQGGVIVENCRVDGFVRERGRIARVATSNGEIAARDVVLALGAWSPQLARSLDLRLPVQPGKGYSITYTRPGVCPRIPLSLKERSVCVTAWADGYRLGSTMEFSGYDTSLNAVRLAALRRGAAEYVREPVGPVQVEEWYGWRPMTFDDLPIIGRAGADNLMLATGHGMLGVSMSAATGALVRDLVCGDTPSIDPTPYRPDRF